MCTHDCALSVGKCREMSVGDGVGQCEHTVEAVSCPNAACLTQLEIGAGEEDEQKSEDGNKNERIRLE